jgi:hypothetical protein
MLKYGSHATNGTAGGRKDFAGPSAWASAARVRTNESAATVLARMKLKAEREIVSLFIIVQ